MKSFVAICWFIITLVLLTLPAAAFPKQSWLDNIHFDKVVHVGLFSVLVFLFFWAITRAEFSFEKKKNRLLGIALVGLAYGVAMEFVQKYWIPNRNFDVFDILADGVGCFLPFVFLKQMVKALFSSNAKA